MKGFKLSPIHLPPIKKIKVKRAHYRMVLVLSSGAILVCAVYAPEHEMHVAFATNLLFALDPTV